MYKCTCMYVYMFKKEHIDMYVYVSRFVCWKNREHKTLSKETVEENTLMAINLMISSRKETLTCPTIAL